MLNRRVISGLPRDPDRVGKDPISTGLPLTVMNVQDLYTSGFEVCDFAVSCKRQRDYRKHEEIGCHIRPQCSVRAESVEALAFQPLPLRCILLCFGMLNLKSWMIDRTVEVELCHAAPLLFACVSLRSRPAQLLPK